MSKLKIFLALMLSGTMLAQAQTDVGMMRMNEFKNPIKRNTIQIPDFGGFQTLKCDFHMHTVFSDGHVWPNVRVQEAWKEGLDVIAITDHIEYLPHKSDIITNHNRPYELAKDMANEKNIILIKGSEITRHTPPGHFNAIFTSDASGFIGETTGLKDKMAVLKSADQKAFIFWNHPGWKVNQIDGSYEWIDFVDELYKEQILQGIEVINGFSFHKKALDWCIDKNLTILGSSDVHNLVEHDYNLGEVVNRSMTLVFAKDRTQASIREALDAGRTVAWASKYIAGREELVAALFNACVETGPVFYSKTSKNNENEEMTTNFYVIKNISDLYFELELKSGNGTETITLFPISEQVISARSGQSSLEYAVITAFIRSDKNLVVNIPLK